MLQGIQSRISFLLKVMIIGVSLTAVVSAAMEGSPAKVPGSEQQKKLLNKVAPVYPAEAKEKGITGTVRLQAIIAVDGTVKDLKVLSGDEVFIPNTVKAVKQWTYETTHVNGKAVEVITDIDVNFKLAQ